MKIYNFYLKNSMHQNIQCWNSCILNAHAPLLMGHSSSTWKGSCVVRLLLEFFFLSLSLFIKNSNLIYTNKPFVSKLLEMGLLMEGKVFIIEYYFCSYGKGHEKGSSLEKVAEQFWESFNKTEPGNSDAVCCYEISPFW
jgi:hypothetical protein